MAARCRTHAVRQRRLQLPAAIHDVRQAPADQLMSSPPSQDVQAPQQPSLRQGDDVMTRCKRNAGPRVAAVLRTNGPRLCRYQMIMAASYAVLALCFWTLLRGRGLLGILTLAGQNRRRAPHLLPGAHPGAACLRFGWPQAREQHDGACTIIFCMWSRQRSALCKKLGIVPRPQPSTSH